MMILCVKVQIILLAIVFNYLLVIFLVDRSGSMSGSRINQAKNALQLFLRRYFLHHPLWSFIPNAVVYHLEHYLILLDLVPRWPSYSLRVLPWMNKRLIGPQNM